MKILIILIIVLSGCASNKYKIISKVETLEGFCNYIALNKNENKSFFHSCGFEINENVYIIEDVP